ncbi:mannosyltransferase [Winogradskyella sp. Asnod2-B02-A]|uniref:mannosyltransferase n=1 Tax=Winogradskyella sp. Asnod2-B02-A TaxID=3160583 RepID=UPI003868C64F
MIALWKYHKIPVLFFIASCILYLWFAYNITRLQTTQLLILYIALFAFAYNIIKTSGFNFRLLVIFSILVRFLFLFAIPNLSQDFYRFIWDGQMILSGLNPYLSTPDFQMELGILTNFPNQVELHNGMGSLSASHFTNYPPINQLCFVLANLFPGKSILSSVIGLRLIIIAADIGTLYFGKKLLERLKLPSNRIFWYILNPFIIIELTGNLHFEGVMIFFLVWSLYILHSGQWKWAAVILACSISVKLIPLMLLPLFFGYFKKGGQFNNIANKFKEPAIIDELSKPKVIINNLLKLIAFYAIVGLTSILLFMPFFSMEFVTNYTKTVGLWFGNFEFNASIYYLSRAIGYAITGYNEIAIIGKILPVISILIILGFSFFKQNDSISKLISSMLLVLTLYLFLSTTVHPWYIATLVFFSVFTNYKYPLVWSLVIALSYLAYSNTENSENLWIIALEYTIVFSVFVWEVFLKKSQLNTLASN